MGRGGASFPPGRGRQISIVGHIGVGVGRHLNGPHRHIGTLTYERKDTPDAGNSRERPGGRASAGQVRVSREGACERPEDTGQSIAGDGTTAASCGAAPLGLSF